MFSDMKNKFLVFLRVLIGISILLYVLATLRIGDLSIYSNKSTFECFTHNISQLMNKILLINKPLFILGLFLIVLSYFLSFARWYLLLKAHDIKIPFKRVISLGFIGVLFNNVMPSTVGGDLVKAYYATKDTSKRTTVVTTVLVDRIIGMGSLLLLSVLVAPFYLTTKGLNNVAIVVLGLFAFALICFWLVLHPKLMEKISLFEKGKISGKLVKMYNALYYYKNKPKTIIICIGISLILQTLAIFVQYLLVIAMGYNSIHFLDFMLLIPAITFICAIPISIMGWGIGEAAYKELLKLVAIPPVISVGLSLITRVSMMVINLFGLPLYIMHKPANGLKEIENIIEKGGRE